MGAPTKYTDDMPRKVIELMKQGASKYEVALELDICEDTFYEYKKIHKDFSEAIKKGEWFSRGKWEKEGRLSLRDKEFNSTLWYMNMKNRHGWTDKTYNENFHEVSETERKIRKAEDQYK